MDSSVKYVGVGGDTNQIESPVKGFAGHNTVIQRVSVIYDERHCYIFNRSLRPPIMPDNGVAFLLG